MGRRRLLVAIEEAFPRSPMPACLSGRPACGDDEYAYVERFFRDREWTELTLEALRDHYQGPPDACLSFMSHEAFRYFLPAFLRFFIERWEEADAIADAVIFSLVPTCDPRLKAWQAARFSGFDDRQRRVIADFLDYAGQRHHPEYDRFGLPDAKHHWRGAA